MILTPGRKLIAPAAETMGPLVGVVLLVLFAAVAVGDRPAPEAAATGVVGWLATLGVTVALWIGGLALRKTDHGLRALLSLACGLSLAGLTLIFARSAEPFPMDATWPKTAFAVLGLQALAVSAGPLVAAFGIEYRRTDPWYVVAFGAALVPWVVAGGLWLMAAWESTGGL